MNIQANNFVRSLRGLSPQEKSVAYTIASHADYLKCECTASMSTIAAESGFKNRETASRITKRLEIDYGIIKAVGAHSGGKKPTTYTFTMEVNRDSGITVAISREDATVTQHKSNRDSHGETTVTLAAPTVTQNAPTVTGESHEGFKVLEGKRKREREKGESQQAHSLSCPAGGLISPQDEGEVKPKPALVDRVVAIAHEEAIRQKRATPVLSNKSLATLSPILDELQPYESELRIAIRQVVGTCDEFMMRNLGNHLATNLPGLIRAQWAEMRRAQEAEDREYVEQARYANGVFESELTKILGKPQRGEEDFTGQPSRVWTVGNCQIHLDGGTVGWFEQVGEDNWQRTKVYKLNDMSQLRLAIQQLIIEQGRAADRAEVEKESARIAAEKEQMESLRANPNVF